MFWFNFFKLLWQASWFIHAHFTFHGNLTWWRQIQTRRKTLSTISFERKTYTNPITPNLIPEASWFQKYHFQNCRDISHTQGNLPPESFCSTSLAPLGANWVSKEAENFKELEFFGLVRYFSVKTEKSSKTSKIEPKTWKKRHFLGGFLKFVQFWLKSSAPNQKIWVPWSFTLLLTPCLPPKARD